ncbi:MAG: TIR domain-containing protein [Anaerolineales bacterium]|nr:TIR domain-containing protein [Anaerolineales bacterium]
MTDAFISYSRKDIAFARILHSALTDQGVGTWIDWQDIPPSADWLAEVYEAIEQADSFIFIISPTSVESEICSLEIAHAAKNNKRLIPIVINNIDPTLVPTSLSHLNWIFFREEDEAYSVAVSDLITAIQTDQGWVKEHTRIQMRALEWERKDQEGGFLLRGRDLSEAEAWLARAAEKDPPPTALQTQYILASRSAATRRQRITFGAVLAGLVIAIALGVLAWTQRNLAVEEGFVRATAQSEAEAARGTAVFEANSRATEVVVRETAQAEAEFQRDLAISRELAVQSSNQLDKNSDLALLLAIEAQNAAETVEAGIALRQALIHPGRTVQILSGHDGALFTAIWNPDGTQILTAGKDGTARIWDAWNGQELATLTGHQAQVISAVWNPDGTQILTASSDGTARTWDVDNALQKEDAEILILMGHEGGITFAAWNPDETRIVTTSRDGTARIWDANTGDELIQFTKHESDVLHAAWHPQDGLIATSGGRTTFIWNVVTGEELTAIPQSFDSGIYALWSEDGTKLVTTAIGDAKIWDIANLTSRTDPSLEPEPLVTHTHFVPAMWIGTIMQASWNLAETQILTVSGNGTAEVWNPENGQTLFSLFGHTDGIYSGAWDLTSERILTASADGTARVWSAETGSQLAVLTSHDEAVLDAVWDPDANRVVTASADGTARIWSVNALDELLSLNASVQERSFWNASGELIATSGYGTQIWNSESGEELAKLEGGFTVWDPSGTRLLIALPDGNFQIWETSISEGVEGEKPLLEFMGHSKQVRHASWNRSSSHVVTTSSDGTARLWDVMSGDGLILIDVEEGPPIYSEWSRDGDGLLVVSPGGVHVWDLPSGGLEDLTEGMLLDEGADSLNHASWNSDGTRIISTSRGGARIWDAQSGQQLIELIGHTGAVSYAVWSPDGRKVLTTSSDNTARLWDGDTGRLLHVLAGHSGPVDYAAWNPQGTMIVTASLDSTARLWDVFSGKELAIVSGYFDAVRHASWKPDGGQFITTSWGGFVRVFAVPTATAEAACNYVVRNLTAEEWETYLGDQPYRDTCPEVSH